MKIQWNLIVIVYQDIERLTLVWKTRKFREELKWNGSSRWKFSGKKIIPFEVLPFFPFLPKRPKYSVPFVWITSARLQVERKRTICRYFVNGTTQSRSCFRCQKNTSTIWRKFFTEISVQMVSAHSIISVSDSNLFTTYVLFITRHGYYALLGILGHRRIKKSLDTWNVTRNAKQRRTNKSWLFFSFSGLCPFLPFLNCS